MGPIRSTIVLREWAHFSLAYWDIVSADWQDEFGQNGSDILQSPREDASSVVESPRDAPLLTDGIVQPSTSVPLSTEAWVPEIESFLFSVKYSDK